MRLHYSALSARRLMRPIAVPCGICGTESEPHACGITLTRPGTLTIVESGDDTYAAAYACAFTRAIRDA